MKSKKFKVMFDPVDVDDAKAYCNFLNYCGIKTKLKVKTVLLDANKAETMLEVSYKANETEQALICLLRQK